MLLFWGGGGCGGGGVYPDLQSLVHTLRKNVCMSTTPPVSRDTTPCGKKLPARRENFLHSLSSGGASFGNKAVVLFSSSFFSFFFFLFVILAWVRLVRTIAGFNCVLRSPELFRQEYHLL